MWWLCFYPRSINRLTAIRRPRTDPCGRGDRALCLALSLAASRAGLGRATMQASRVRPDRNGEGKSEPPRQATFAGRLQQRIRQTPTAHHRDGNHQDRRPATPGKAQGLTWRYCTRTARRGGLSGQQATVAPTMTYAELRICPDLVQRWRCGSSLCPVLGSRPKLGVVIRPTQDTSQRACHSRAPESNSE
jgi:hypothetical protein